MPIPGVPLSFRNKFSIKTASYPLIGVAVFIGAGSPRATFGSSEDTWVIEHD